MSDYDPDAATARADLYRFLSACYYEPEQAFIEENLFNSILIAAERLSPELAGRAKHMGQAFVADDLQTLLVDYTRLFLGPLQVRAQPYGSSWLKTPVITEDNPPLAVLDLYSEGGFELDGGFAELPDHVAVELEFLYLLAYNKNQADTSGQADEARRIEDLQRRFLTEHLGLWIEPFAAAVKSGAETAFYRQLADVTQALVQAEMGRWAAH